LAIVDVGSVSAAAVDLLKLGLSGSAPLEWNAQV
jgi:hypothetical protein